MNVVVASNNYMQSVRDKTLGMTGPGTQYASLRAGFNADTAAVSTQADPTITPADKGNGGYVGSHTKSQPEKAYSALRAQGEQQSNMRAAVNNAQNRPSVTQQPNSANSISTGLSSMRGGTVQREQAPTRPNQLAQFQQSAYAGDMGQRVQDMNAPMYQGGQMLEHPHQIAAYIEQFFKRFAYGGR